MPGKASRKGLQLQPKFLRHCYHTLLEASSSSSSVFPGLALTSHSCKTHGPKEVLAAGPCAVAASGP